MRKNTLIALLLALIMALSCGQVSWAMEEAEEVAAQTSAVQNEETEAEPERAETLRESSASDEDFYNPVVSLKEGKSNGRKNYNALRDALARADGKHQLTIKIKKKGKYYLDSDGAALMFRSMTTLNLNKSTLVRAGKMYNLVQNESLKGERSVKGYTASHDITIQNGTLDGSGNSRPGKNLVNMGHASKITFSNVTLQKGQGTHLMELNGCKDCTISKCTFTGYDKGSSKSLPEAIQLDISYNGAGDDWNGVYCDEGTPGADNTVCKNITIQNCQFKDYPSGVGNHHCLYGGPRNTGIKIKNNTFTNSKSYGSGDAGLAPAIWCYGFENSEVSGNTITGKYSYGIRFSGGSVKVKNNNIGTEKKPVSYPPVYVTKASSYVKNKKDQRKDESVTGGCVDGNTIFTTYTKGNDGAISVYGKSVLSSISKNKVTSTKGTGIVIGGSTVEKVNSNTVSKAGKSAIYITGSKIDGVTVISTVTSVNSNTIEDSKKTGIDVTSSAKVTNVNSNKISGCKEYGIHITNKKITVSVQKNKLTANKKALQVSAKGKIQKK